MTNQIAEYAIGVFDSGCGGLTAVKELNRILPEENIIYFGDTARVPYGNKSRSTVMKYANQDIAFLRKHKIKMVIAACGTVSSVVGEGTLCEDMPFTGVVIPAALKAAKVTKNKKVGVIGTAQTIKSGSFIKAINKADPEIEVVSNPCPLFVHLVECGYTDRNNEVTRLVAKDYLKPLIDAGVDTVIMGCTHFPIIKDIIGDIMGENVALIDTGAQAALYARKVLTENSMRNESGKKGNNTFYVSDGTELFAENAKIFLQSDVVDNVYQAIVS
jgi:glutamate racemase